MIQWGECGTNIVDAHNVEVHTQGSYDHRRILCIAVSPDHLHYIIQSINQTNLYSANIPGEARLSGATAKSVFSSKIGETVP